MSLSSCRSFLAACAVLAGALLPAATAVAHDPRPVVVTIAESLPDIFHVSLRVPIALDAGNQPRLQWPPACAPLQARSASSYSMRCPGGLAGAEVVLEYPGYNPSLATFFQFIDRQGNERSAIVPPSQAGWVIPEQLAGTDVAMQYLVLGIEHILGGPDHLLFVLGLLVIAGTFRRILWTITGFTLAHSITLSLSSLGVISVPIVPVEAGIALSILFLAVEIGRKSHDTLTYRYPVIVSFIFGLLHGLGFASALGQVGLAQGQIVLSLLFFNVGVELGQLAFILAILLVVGLARKLPAAKLVESGGVRLLLSERLAMYVVGVPSAYWLIDRLSFLY